MLKHTAFASHLSGMNYPLCKTETASAKLISNSFCLHFFLQIGPGIVYLEFSSFFGRGVYIQSVTPVEPLVQKVVHNVYIDRRLPTILSKFFMVSEAIQVCSK